MFEDPVRTAAEAGLVYVTDSALGFSRKKRGEKFDYYDADGGKIEDFATLDRIKALVIPPAWTDVWICARANGHLQASGRDARGRKQHRYHPKFREHRERAKFDHVIEFAEGLPALRQRVERDRRKRGLPRDRVLATVVHLLDTTLIRVGNDDYAQQNKSYGLTTLLDRHAKIEGAEVRFIFKGKSGKEWRLALKDRRIANVVKATQDLPGQRLFQYIDDDGAQREVTSSDVNSYLREVTGRDVTAKDFRTWAGTVLAATALAACDAVESETAAKRKVREAIGEVAQRLGNTPTICRKCYVHPRLIKRFIERKFALTTGRGRPGLTPEEAATLAFLKSLDAESAPRRTTAGTKAAAARQRRPGAKGRTNPAAAARPGLKKARPVRSGRG